MIVILILVGYILACILWYNLGKFILAIIAYGFKWNLIKEEMKNTPRSVRTSVYIVLAFDCIILDLLCSG